MTLGVAKQQSVKGAAALEKASGNSEQSSKVKIEEEVRKLRQENKQLRSQSSKSCTRCGKPSCLGGTKCPANGQKCGKCHKMNHFAKACKSKKQTDVGQLSSAEDSDSSESSGRVVVGKIGSSNICANVFIN